MTFDDYLAAGRKARDEDLALVEKELAKMYREAYTTAARELEVFLAKGFSAEEVRKYGRLQGLLDSISTEYKKLTGQALDVTTTASADAYIESWKRLEWSLDKSESLNLKWGMPPVEEIRASVYSDHSGLTVEQIYGKNTIAELSKIQGTLTRGIILGRGYKRVAQELKDDFAGGYSSALRVIRTENTRLWTEGALSAAQQAEDMGIKIKIRWVAALDRRTRESHAMLDGQYADDDGLFWIGGDSAQGPGLFSEPENTVNCRCAITQELEGIPATVRRDHSGIIPYRTYNEWAAQYGWTKESGWPKVQSV